MIPGSTTPVTGPRHPVEADDGTMVVSPRPGVGSSRMASDAGGGAR